MTTSTLTAGRRRDYCLAALGRLEAETRPSATRWARRAKLVAALAQANAELAGAHCTRCQAPLSDPVSVARRLGACCAAKAPR